MGRDVGQDAGRLGEGVHPRVGRGVVGRHDADRDAREVLGGSGSRASRAKEAWRASSANSSPGAAAKAVTRAPAFSSVSARRAAATPPPTTAARLPLTSRNIGR